MIRFSLATENDDAELRALLRDNAMPSWVDISMQREPSFFAGSNGMTDDYAVIARNGEKAVGMYSCSLQQLYINGRPSRIGYLGGLRAAVSHRGRIRALRDGYRSIAGLLPAGDQPFHFTSIASDNRQARRLLEAGLAGMPIYRPCNELVTCVLPVARGKRSNLWRRAIEADIPGLLEFHRREADGFQFAPQLTKEWIRHIGLENFWLCGDGEIMACAAIWDRSASRQLVARSYRQPLPLLLPLYNLYAALARRVALPAPGRALSHSFLAFAAFSADASGHIGNLMRDLLNRCATKTAIISLHASHPLLAALEQLKPLTYRTLIYTVAYDGAPSLDGRPAQPEAALL